MLEEDWGREGVIGPDALASEFEAARIFLP